MLQLPLEQLFAVAVRAHQSGRLAEAEKIYRDILRPSEPGSHAGSAVPNAATAGGAIGPPSAEQGSTAMVLHLLGVLEVQTGRFEQGIASIQAAIAIAPREPIFHNNLGNMLLDHGHTTQSLAAFRRALELRPDYVEAHYNLGNALRATGALDDAIAAYRAAILLRPDYGAAHLNLGAALQARGDLAEAARACREAARLMPTTGQGPANLGNVLRDQGRTDEAIACYRQAMAIEPANPHYGSNLLLGLHYQSPVGSPSLLQESRNWARRHAQPLSLSHAKEAAIPAHANVRDPQRRLRIGYISPDFREHPVSFFLLPLLEHHDRDRVEVFCYSDLRQADAMTRRLQAHAAAWHEIARKPDAVVAELIRGHGVDILVDLAGHTAHNRLLVFARKPAPVQVTYLGYPGTTGLAAIDYRLTDALADPPVADALYVEHLWRLPETAWCFSPPAHDPETRALAEIARSRPGICFGSFNNFAKVSPETLRMWGQVLDAVPDSWLLIKARGLHDPETRHDVLSRMAALGIDPARVELQGWRADRTSHLATYAAVDVALDTFPYHGTTTTCEALWMGVPVVTLAPRGDTGGSWTGASLLTNAGLPDCIARSTEQYIATAGTLARDPHRLSALKAGQLRDHMRRSPLMDAPAFARAIEDAYRAMWKKWLASPP